MSRIRKAVAVLCSAAAFATHAGEYTDLWWNPQESGWGANIVHQGETAFVTLFVYGPDGKPTWYVASGARTFAYDASGRPALHGTLYRTRGPWLGGPFDPSSVQVEPVGSMTIEPAPGGSLTLYYVAEGIAVSKSLVRQTFELPAFGSNYHGSFSLRQAIPGQGPWGTRQYAGEILLHLDEGQAFLRVTEDSGRCEYRGSHSQWGKLGRIAGSFQCDDGAAGTFEITDFEIGKHGISGYLRTWSPANNQYGRFGAALY
ncbi:MAG: hypothetical protein AB7S87_15170 [Burkholderiales bacterium]